MTALLERLAGLRETGPGRFLARCPAHTDKSPSLSIRLLDDRRVLVHCFAGCEVGDVVAAVGLSMSSLFPPPPLGHHFRAERQRFPAADILEALAHEAVVLVLSAEGLAEISPMARDRLLKAAGRIRNGLDMAGISKVPPEMASLRRGEFVA